MKRPGWEYIVRGLRGKKLCCCARLRTEWGSLNVAYHDLFSSHGGDTNFARLLDHIKRIL